MPRPREFKHNQVIQRAMDVFWIHGYEATSITDLTEATELKPGSLYNAFGSKHAIYLECLDFYNEHVGRCLFNILEEPISGKEAIRQLFVNLIEEEVNDSQHRGCMMHKAITERAGNDPDIRMRAAQSATTGEMKFKSALERAQSSGDISGELNIDQVATYLVSMIFAVRTMAQSSKNRQTLMGIVEVALSVLG